MDIPTTLRTALDAELAAIPTRRLQRATATLITRYRDDRPEAGAPLLVDDADIAAYAAYRMPATYAAVVAVLEQTAAQWLGEPPRSLLDAGAGPGTAMWAALEIWPELEQVTLLERDTRMIALGRRLATHADADVVRDARWQQTDLLSEWETEQHDLVIATYVLNELPEARQAEVVERLWYATSGALMLVEPGTPAGFARIRQARQQLLAEGAAMLAPCPHERACPLPDHDWCHFGQRVNRSRVQRAAKGGTLSYEDEKYSYVAVARHPAGQIAARVIRRPRILPGRVELELCTPEGLRSTLVTRAKDRRAFRIARGLGWGGALPVDDGAGEPHSTCL